MPTSVSSLSAAASRSASQVLQASSARRPRGMCTARFSARGYVLGFTIGFWE